MIKETKVWNKFNTCHNIYINSGFEQDKLHGWLPASVLSSNDKTPKCKVFIPNKYNDYNTNVEKEVSDVM